MFRLACYVMSFPWSSSIEIVLFNGILKGLFVKNEHHRIGQITYFPPRNLGVLSVKQRLGQEK